jgi:hypothetical protein
LGYDIFHGELLLVSQIYKKIYYKILIGINLTNMAAKAKGKGSASSMKITFGKRKSGKAQKSWGPKAQKPKKYRGQGR